MIVIEEHRIEKCEMIKSFNRQFSSCNKIIAFKSIGKLD